MTGKSSKGRAVSRSYAAQTEEGARKQAVRDGVAVETVDRLPSEPATERQLAYARTLGVRIPDAPSLDQMSDLIARAVEQPAEAWLVRRARELGADLAPDRFLGIGYVSRQINEAVGVGTPAFISELVFWFLHSVLRHRKQGEWPSPEDSGVPDEVVRSAAADFEADRAALESMRRECGERLGYYYAVFGDGYGGTLSTRTKAYARAVHVLTQRGIL